MPPVRLEDEEERHDERGKDAVEVHLLRRELGAEDRQRGEAARGLPRLAPHAQAQADMPGGGRTFRRRASRFWAILPMSLKVEKPRGVIYVDGMHLGRGPLF